VRKPEGVGAEIKAVADGSTSIIMRLDIMEGKERQAAKEFADIGCSDKVTPHETLFGHKTGRSVHLDFAFLFWHTLLDCRARGLCNISDNSAS
jgi:hypothetical protein